MTAAASLNLQLQANDPSVSAFVTANAGSGKTSTLVGRVARLLLRGARPETILCLTFTKAAAAEMQRRLFQTLGSWAVMADEALAEALAGLGEAPEDLSKARRLFAQALETPGGLKIQTIHAFCEKLLRRFPLEAGVSPGFVVLEDSAAVKTSREARDGLAEHAYREPDSRIGQAYERLSIDLDYERFGKLFADFEARRREINAFVESCESHGGLIKVVWKNCGLDHEIDPVAVETEALDLIDWSEWKKTAEAVYLGKGATDAKLAERMMSVGPESSLAEIWDVLSTEAGKPLARLGTASVADWAKTYLKDEQARLDEARILIATAQVAIDSLHVLHLAHAYSAFYEAYKALHGALDFGDLIVKTLELLTKRSDAAWVLYKLDGGIDHVLVDEAQDTAPDQWNIIRALTSEFFVGAGRLRGEGHDERTVFAVGDEKQSIFSFQGADPARLLTESQHFQTLVEEVDRQFKAVSLAESWRSTPEVLSFVDSVFLDPEARLGLSPPQADGEGPLNIITHLARRPAGFGAVDLWPLVQNPPKLEIDPWKPVDAEPEKSANKVLAQQIANDIKTQVQRGDAVQDRESKTGGLRPVSYGDFLILVRRRGPLFQEIIRALKREGVPVGGADRLKLSEHVVFKDLLGLAQFCLFTDDHLMLAALLRSPFCDVDETSLYDLAHDRRGGLWATLTVRGDERPEWLAARQFFGWARQTAGAASPFDFYAKVMSRLDGNGRSMRERLLSRLGKEAEEALDAFLAQALAAEARGVHDLEQFVAEMAALEIDVKREQEDGKGEVRVMTAHGAKGLEAPIVYLPDTATKSSAQGTNLMQGPDGAFYWAPKKINDIEPTAQARQMRAQASDHESLRLLYVALTRARDRLVVCGVEPGKPNLKVSSWYDYVERALNTPAIADQVREVPFLEGALRRFGADPILAARSDSVLETQAALPAWARALAKQEALGTRYASPSTLAETDKGPAPSPLATLGGLGRYRRGDLIHKLLQVLPDLPPEQFEAGAQRILARERDLTDDQRLEMTKAALAVLTDPQFASVFGPGSRPEVAIAGRAEGLPDNLAISGRVDRLIVSAERVLVVDFKTNRPAPSTIDKADRSYLVQMAVYVAVLRELFTGRAIEAALVWTDGPKLMPVPNDLVAKILDSLKSH